MIPISIPEHSAAPQTLYIVSTPIGNLQDISLRALSIFHSVTTIAAEDTRHSRRLLDAYHINTPLISYHAFNEQQQFQPLLARLEKGESLALISDAGTPLISDPGYILVHAARQAGFAVVPIPGCCAAIAALSVAGLPSQDFRFMGFLSTKTTERQRRLEALLQGPSTLIFYEAPHRILSLMQLLMSLLADSRQVVLAKELTKTFETIMSGTAIKIYQWLSENPLHQKGEFVILIEGAPKSEEPEISAQDLNTLKVLLADLPVKQAVSLGSKITGIAKNRLYALALKL
ncbi:MAG: 16S rRNA (cytidine(1402)-2'-O)-methyltransferase [Gammaproteobacteria bacterium]